MLLVEAVAHDPKHCRPSCLPPDGRSRLDGPCYPHHLMVRIRLTRVGSRRNPIWRVVVADQRSPRDGKFIEVIGQYNAQTEPSTVKIDSERLQYWLDRGAQPSDTVKKLARINAAQEPVAAAS